MAVQITITATDRNGKHLAHRVIKADLFQFASDELAQIYEELKDTYKDHNGVTPYIFTNSKYT